jgi:hypothetical protein
MVIATYESQGDSMVIATSLKVTQLRVIIDSLVVYIYSDRRRHVVETQS